MRIVSLIFIVAIVYLVFGRGGEKQSVQSRIAEAQQESALVQPGPKSEAPAAGASSLRAPIDRTRQALKTVQTRNQEPLRSSQNPRESGISVPPPNL